MYRISAFLVLCATVMLGMAALDQQPPPAQAERSASHEYLFKDRDYIFEEMANADSSAFKASPSAEAIKEKVAISQYWTTRLIDQIYSPFFLDQDTSVVRVIYSDAGNENRNFQIVYAPDGAHSLYRVKITYGSGDWTP